MFVKLALFIAWAFLGAVFSYGLFYALTPYGIAILAFASLGAWLLPNRAPEAWGLLAGPGVMAALIAMNTDEDPTGWIAGSAVLIGLSVVAFVASGKTRWVRS